jgi:formylglycine-generating enzyme required for sulfatase activity
MFLCLSQAEIEAAEEGEGMLHLAARILAPVILLLSTALDTVAGKRVALVIGNSAYTLAPLPNPRNDADDVAAALERLNFQVTKRKDLTIREFDRTLDDFIMQAKDADAVLFFFSGHGIQIDKRGYLAPTDVRVESESSALRELVSIQEVISRIENAGTVSVIVLDACRDSPLQERIRRIALEKNKALVPPKGLPPVSVVGSNTLIVYATVPGEAASDGTGRNSPFTASLLKHMETPGLEIELMFKRVTADVLKGTNGKQQPERLSRLQNELVLLPEKLEAPAQVAAVAPPKPPAPAVVSCQVGLLVSRGQTGERGCIKPGSGESFRDCPECPEMVVVPSGSFLMGSADEERPRTTDEVPQHRVTIGTPFAAGMAAVTRDEFDAFVRDSGYNMDGGCYISAGAELKVDSTKSYLAPGYQQTGAHPAVCVSVNDALAYTAWLSKKTGENYRLLSEAEREYVTRAGTKTPFWWGASISPDQANYDGTAEVFRGGGQNGEFRRKPVPVKSFKPNPWGLYQVHGNIWEWVEDCWVDRYNGAPGDGSAWTTADCSRRVLRGGAWRNGPSSLRAASRLKGYARIRYISFGFRVARTVSP